MNTKHAREIRKGIRFASLHCYALGAANPADIPYHDTWADSWLETASVQALRAYFRTRERLEYKLFLNQLRTEGGRDALRKIRAENCAYRPLKGTLEP